MIAEAKYGSRAAMNGLELPLDHRMGRSFLLASPDGIRIRVVAVKVPKRLENGNNPERWQKVIIYLM